MNYNLTINEKFDILNDVIEDLPIEFIRQIKINYDSIYVSTIIKRTLNDNNDKIIFNELKYDNYKMEDLYFLISKTSHILSLSNIKINYFVNFKKDGYNLFINSSMFCNLYIEDDDIILVKNS